MKKKSFKILLKKSHFQGLGDRVMHILMKVCNPWTVNITVWSLLYKSQEMHEFLFVRFFFCAIFKWMGLEAEFSEEDAVGDAFNKLQQV